MRCKRNRNGKFNPGNRTVAKIIMGKSSHNGQRQASGIAVAPYNRLTEKEIRKKLPDRFFKKSKEKKEWLGKQVDFQNLNYEVTLIKPASTEKLTKNTKRIVGRTMKNVENLLWTTWTLENGQVKQPGLRFLYAAVTVRSPG